MRPAATPAAGNPETRPAATAGSRGKARPEVMGPVALPRRPAATAPALRVRVAMLPVARVALQPAIRRLERPRAATLMAARRAAAPDSVAAQRMAARRRAVRVPAAA